jgi:hypothetical protein
VEVYPGGRRLQGRPIPLHTEVVRERTGPLRAHRVRGRIAVVLAGTGGRRANDTLRGAVLTLGSTYLSMPHCSAAARQPSLPAYPRQPIRVPDYSSHRPRPRAPW